jgi:Cu/Ag efflux pump CusA
MAVTVISGLISSTVLTLLIIPVVYSVTDRLFSRAKKDADPAEAESP